MRVLVAPDSFGGTLSAVQAADAIAAGWRDGAPGDEVTTAPLSDGGPGFVDVLHSELGGQLLTATVEDPLGRPVPGAVLLVDRTAYVESAQACGLHLLAAAERDPLRASSYGVGQLLTAALDAGLSRVVVGLGGSGTNDGGAGALQALGVQRLDAEGARLLPGGAALARVDQVLAGELDVRLADVELVLATDVDSPLLGITGASAVFGPQKGASREDVAMLDAALTRWAGALEQALALPTDLRARPGTGAAGGLGFALQALGAIHQPGIATVLDLLALRERVAASDLLVTGEGSFDWQSLRGKVVAGVASAAQEAGLPCLVLAGQVSVGRREAAAAGVEASYSMAEAAGSVAAAQASPAEELRRLAGTVAREWSRPRRGPGLT